MTALRELFAEYFVRFDDRQLEQGAKSTDDATDKLNDLDDVVSDVGKKIKGFGSALAGVFAAGAMREMISSTLTATNELSRWGQRLQMNVGEVAAWSRIAEPFGADIDDVTDAFKELQLKAQDALTGGTAQAEMYQRIGISLDDLRPVVNDNAALMDLFVSRLNSVNDAGLRNFTVDELMSDAGTRMLPVFMQGTERLRELREEMLANSGSTAELASRMGSWNTASSRVNAGLENLKATVVLSMMPAMEKFANTAASIVNGLHGILENSRAVEAAIVVLTGVMVGIAVATAPIWGPMALTVAGVAAAFFILVGIVDDLMVTFDGGDSITRRFIDGLLGEGSTAHMIQNLSTAWNDLTDALENFARFIAMTPALNLMTFGLFEGVLNRTERSRARLLRRHGGGRTVREAFGSDYIPIHERRELDRRQRVSDEEREAMRRLGVGTGDYVEAGEQTVWSDTVASQVHRSQNLAHVARGEQEFGLGVSQGMSVIPREGQTNISQGNRTTINVNGAQDPRQTAELVREVVREENERQLRQTQATLVPGSQ